MDASQLRFLMDAGQIRFHGAMRGTPFLLFFNFICFVFVLRGGWEGDLLETEDSGEQGTKSISC